MPFRRAFACAAPIAAWFAITGVPSSCGAGRRRSAIQASNMVRPSAATAPTANPFASMPRRSPRALRTGEPVLGAELVIERPDGSRVPVLMNAAPLKDQTGRVEGAVCSFQELTERKRAEEALRASEAELQSVINRTPFMLVRCSRDLRYRFISEAYAQMIGRRRDEVIGKTIAEMLGDGGFQYAAPLYREGAARRGGGFRMRTRLSGNRIAPPHIAYRPETDAKGNVDGWIASLLDITEQKRADRERNRVEAELRQVSEQLEAEVEKRTLERDRIWNVSEDLLAVSNFEGYFLSINPAWTRLLGWSEDEIKSMHVSELRHPDDTPHSDRRPAAAGARRADRAHGKSLPPQGRLVALAAMDHDREQRPDLCRRPSCYRGKRSRCRARTRAKPDRAFAEDGRHRAADRRHRARLQQSFDDRQRPRAEPEKPPERNAGTHAPWRRSKWRRRAART